MTRLVAAFPMYQRTELRPAFDALWFGTGDLLRAEGIAAPEALTVVEDDLLSFWQRPTFCSARPADFRFGIS